MPTYRIACKNQHYADIYRSFGTYDDLPDCLECGQPTARQFTNAPVHFVGGRQGFHDNTARDMNRRTRDGLIAKHGRKAALERFDERKIDPDETDEPQTGPPKRKRTIDEIEKRVLKNPAGKRALGELHEAGMI